MKNEVGTVETLSQNLMQRDDKEVTKIERLDDLRIVREVGRGGMGIVYEAEQESLRRRVAVKVLSDSALLNTNQRRRFEREARAAARLHHTNIVQVFGVGENHGLHYYVMQFIEGQGLHEVLAEIKQHRDGDGIVTPTFDDSTLSLGEIENQAARGSTSTLNGGSPRQDQGQRPENVAAPGAEAVFPGGLKISEVSGSRPTATYWREVARVGIQAAEALDYAHHQDTLHRDIKPANLLLDNSGTVWITDFGLAKLAGHDDITRSGVILGTLKYMAPECFHGGGDARSDIYGLGLTLYEFLTLTPPFDEETPAKLIRQVTQTRPPAPRKHNPAVPRDLETIVLKAIARDPARRYGSARELAEDLEAFLEGRAIRARRTTAPERFVRWCRRNSALASLSSAAFTLLVLIAIVSTVAYIETSNALARASQQQEKAENNWRLATAAFDEIISQASPLDMPTVAEQWSDEDTGDVTSFHPIVSEEFVAILQKLLKFYERFAANNTDNPSLQLEMARAHQRVGDIQQRFSQLDDAESAYQRGLEVFESLAEADGDSSLYWHERTTILNNLGLLHVTWGLREEARQFHRRSFELLEKVSETMTPSASYRLLLARTHCLLGDVGGQQGTLSRQGPRDHHHAARKLLVQLCEEEPENPSYKLDLARLDRRQRFWLPRKPGSDHEVGQDIDVIQMLTALVEKYPGEPEYLYELGETHALRGQKRRRSVDGSGGAGDLERAVDIAAQLVQKYPSVPQYRVALARHRILVSDLIYSKQDLDRARTYYRVALEDLELLGRRSPDIPAYKLFIAMARFGLAMSTIDEKSISGAVTLFEEAVDCLEAYITATNSRHARFMIVRHYKNFSKALRALEKYTLAEQYSDKAAAASAALVSERRRRGRREVPPATDQSRGGRNQNSSNKDAVSDYIKTL